MASFRKIGRNWFFRYITAEGIQRERKGCPDRRETEAMANACEAEAARIRSGLSDSKEEARRRYESRPLADHLAEWHKAMLAQAATPKHANQCRGRVDSLLKLSRSDRVSDLTVFRVQTALGILRDKGDGLALRTLHHYVRNAKAFSRWLWRDGRTTEDKLAHLQPPANPDTDRRRERRALTPEEVSALLRAAESGPVVFKMSGVDRAAMYRLALGTGFRAGELQSLRPESFDLDSDQPTVTVEAGHSKRRRRDVQPIRGDLATSLGRWLSGRPAKAALFPVSSYHTAEMFRADLERAGIPFRDDSGRVADFHALRHTFVSTLARSSASVKVVQTLARHSTPVLTLGTYTHLGLCDQRAALEALPAEQPPGPGAESATQAATGTHGRMNNHPSLRLPYGGDGTGRIVSEPDGSGEASTLEFTGSSSNHNPLTKSAVVASSRSLSDPDGSGGGGIRTHGRFEASAVFKTAPIGHSGTPPIGRLDSIH